MAVPLLDLKAQYRAHKSEIDEAMLRVAESQHFIMGPEVEKLEKSLCTYLECKHAIAVSSGTDALLVALMALDIQPGDEVIVPTYSFFATAGVVARLHAKPVFVDSDPLTFNIRASDIEKKITAKTRVIMPVHLFGQSSDMGAIMAVAKKHNLKVIEDGAQAIGVQYSDGKKVGNFGDIGCFSFFPSKNLGCFGDGGLVTTNDDALGEKLRVLRVHGGKPKYYHKMIGGNFRLDAIQAAVLNVKLPHLDNWSQRRRENADLYTQLFIAAGVAEAEGKITYDSKNKVLLPKAAYRTSGAKNHHIYNQYVIRVEKRDALRKYLTDKQIGNEVYYPVPFHRQECFGYLGEKDTDFPNANAQAEQSLAVPIYPELTKEQISEVVNTITEFVKA
ncbi:MAG TPA: DegT/DnrJ/EryC1/StrS family aminotransferase [bacterium]|nr:DegT/DnrJ/EryC1/StrS family aminotransferase [bacterium]HMW32650.1 DegT/DnrJ/EryC1/StrS family aminotransferase [bacterium]HMW35115.1 DegT/DnrJ/EryC1/StrS family aminotransferase [bacterium]HMY35238.1 DegT/DnrJ/EryC1/StrS family aminotransferase [bacterium]HMZ04836.1 DegT/DnrJ/EryC1/StrS family aminotransferase [bacterium]